MTVARALSKLGVTSRSQAAAWVKDGLVAVNGTLVRSPELWIDPRVDAIAVRGVRIRKRREIYLAMNKPPGCVTTRSDERSRRSVYEFLPPGLPWVFPIGRLDLGTSGLLLFTNDTRFGERTTNPYGAIPKTYLAELDRALLRRDKEAMERGLSLSDGTALKPARLEVSAGNPETVRITIIEGKNRQVRRMFGELGYEVLSLKRTAIGAIVLGSLAEGLTRPLTERERASITESSSGSDGNAGRRQSNR